MTTDPPEKYWGCCGGRLVWAGGECGMECCGGYGSFLSSVADLFSPELWPFELDPTNCRNGRALSSGIASRE